MSHFWTILTPEYTRSAILAGCSGICFVYTSVHTYVHALATVLYLQLPPSLFLVVFTLHSSPLSLISFSLVISPPSPQFYSLSLPFSLTSVFLHSPFSFLCSLFLLTTRWSLLVHNSSAPVVSLSLLLVPSIPTSPYSVRRVCTSQLWMCTTPSLKKVSWNNALMIHSML